MRWLIAHPGPSFSVHDVFMGWAEALRGLGEDVYVYNLDHRLQFYDCALVETGTVDDDGHPGVRKALDRAVAIELAANGILSACYQTWPDVVLGISAFFLPEYLLDMMRGRGHKVVLLHSESPYQDDEQLVRAAHADVNLLNDPVNIAAYQALGVPVAYMPHAYRPAVHRPGDGIAGWRCDLAFAGTGFPSRAEFFAKMHPRLDGVRVRLAGFWDQLGPDDPLREWLLHDPDCCIDNERAVELYNSAKCGINVYRRESETTHAGEGWAMGPREVELAASGLFFLRDPRPEGDTALPMLPTFTSAEDAADQLRWWLAHDHARSEAASAARAAVADRTFENNAKALMRLITGG
jgi:spore maturation protein CgeB